MSARMTPNKSPKRQSKHTHPTGGTTTTTSGLQDDSDEHTGAGTADKTLLANEMRSHKNRGFHDGYDEGKKSTLQGAYDSGYKKAFEQNFILSTLKGVANALKSSHRNHAQQTSGQSQSRPTSAISSSPCSTTSSTSTTASSSTTSTPHSTIGRRSMAGGSSSSRILVHGQSDDRPGEANVSDPRGSKHTISSSKTSSSTSRRRQSSPFAQKSHIAQHSSSSAASMSGGEDVASTCSSSSINSNRSSTGAGYYSSTNVSISSNHLSLLESMKFDSTSDIESIKKDLIKICRENRLEILAHYVSQIG